MSVDENVKAALEGLRKIQAVAARMEFVIGLRRPLSERGARFVRREVEACQRALTACQIDLCVDVGIDKATLELLAPAWNGASA